MRRAEREQQRALPLEVRGAGRARAAAARADTARRLPRRPASPSPGGRRAPRTRPPWTSSPPAAASKKWWASSLSGTSAAGRVARLEQMRQRAMQCDAPRRRQLLVDRLAHQRVREAIAPRRARHARDEVALERRRQRLEQRLDRAARRAAPAANFEVAADHRRGCAARVRACGGSGARRCRMAPRTPCEIGSPAAAGSAHCSPALRPQTAQRPRRRRTGCPRFRDGSRAPRASGAACPAAISMKRPTSASFKSPQRNVAGAARQRLRTSATAGSCRASTSR